RTSSSTPWRAASTTTTSTTSSSRPTSTPRTATTSTWTSPTDPGCSTSPRNRVWISSDMKTTNQLARARAPGGAELVLYERDGTSTSRANGLELMSSRAHGSEEHMAELAVAAGACRVLVGGLGLGYTARAVLDRVGPDAAVIVAEVVPAVVAWNRVHLGHLAGRPLDDP